jgi:hypothetical protein
MYLIFKPNVFKNTGIYYNEFIKWKTRSLSYDFCRVYTMSKKTSVFHEVLFKLSLAILYFNTVLSEI